MNFLPSWWHSLLLGTKLGKLVLGVWRLPQPTPLRLEPLPSSIRPPPVPDPVETRTAKEDEAGGGWLRKDKRHPIDTSGLGCLRLYPGKAVFLRAQASLGSRGRGLQPESTQHRPRCQRALRRQAEPREGPEHEREEPDEMSGQRLGCTNEPEPGVLCLCCRQRKHRLTGKLFIPTRSRGMR